jgi:hypothetical protein
MIFPRHYYQGRLILTYHLLPPEEIVRLYHQFELGEDDVSYKFDYSLDSE